MVKIDGINIKRILNKDKLTTDLSIIKLNLKFLIFSVRVRDCYTGLISKYMVATKNTLNIKPQIV